MEDPEQAMRDIIRNLVQNDDIELQRRTIYRYFSPNAVLDHPLTHQKGRREITIGYQVSVRKRSSSYKPESGREGCDGCQGCSIHEKARSVFMSNVHQSYLRIIGHS
jgi:hypothetical protein